MRDRRENRLLEEFLVELTRLKQAAGIATTIGLATIGATAGTAATAVTEATIGAVASPAPATVPQERIAFHIERGSLEQALRAYALTTGRQLLYRNNVVVGRVAPALTGQFSADEALRRLLAGSPIMIAQPSARVVVLSIVSRGSEPPVATPKAKVPRPQTSAPDGVRTLAKDTADATVAEIVVTGSHIRGKGNSGSPLLVLERDAIDRLGRTTIAQTIADLPQNFLGQASEQSALTLADGSGSNAGLATGVNLRGLGAGATLVLVNGRRLAGTGTMGDFNDVSSLPTAAVERVEILLDGASALYGSDAVGGVVNVILKQRYSGAETRLEAGHVTAGGLADYQASQTLGRVWPTGSILLSYEFYHRDALASSRRDYARSADLRPLGGTDHRQFYSRPGNILTFDPVLGTFGPTFAIRAGQDGTAFRPGDFIAGAVNLENQRIKTDLIPEQSRHSVYARATQQFGEHVTLSTDGRYSRRTFAVRGQGAPAVLVVTPDNPFFVSPTGASSELIAYSFARELGPSQTRGRAETIGVSAGADVELGQWQARTYIAFAQQRESNQVSNIINLAALGEALGTSPDDTATAYNPGRDGFFNPYGDTGSNPAAVLGFVGSGFQLFRSRSQVTTYNLDADGPLMALPGGTLRLAVGGNVRREDFQTSGRSFLFTSTPTDNPLRRSARTVRAVFAELRIPIVGVANARPGIAALDLTAAVRSERYSDSGSTTNPKFGIVWTPLDGLRARASWGTSFRAPGLRESEDRTQISATILPNAIGGQTAIVLLSGGNSALRPERAGSWSAGADWSPPQVPGLRASLGWFSTAFRQRIAEPALDDLNNALIKPELVPFVDAVSPATNAADLAKVTALINDPRSTAQGSFPPEAIGAIVDGRFVNTGRTDVDGLDFAVNYDFVAGAQRWQLGASGTWLAHFREQLTPTAVPLDTANTTGKPLRLRARLSADWTRGEVGGGLLAHLANRYRDALGNRIDSWTTFDLQLRYQPASARSLLKGLIFALNVQNLFAARPPFFDSPAGVGYDAANADALGRFVSVQITRRW